MAELVPQLAASGPPKEEEEEACCAICFESRPFVDLPCACNVNYCAACWDHALATSVTVRGRAQCPSCRTAFRVDFDVEAGRLVFAADVEGTALKDWRTRLYGKARPVQKDLLRQYGAALTGRTPSPPPLPHLVHTAELTKGGVDFEPGRPADEAPPSPAAMSRATSAASHEQSGPDGTACEATPVPLCVCGAQLERVSSRGRVERMLHDTDASWRARVLEPEQLVERLASSSIITCDLCDGVATKTGALWTCKNGPHTVLHPSAYDVCERCFKHYVAVGSTGGLAGESLGGPCPTEHSEEDCQGCCQSCIAALRRALPSRWQRRGAADASAPGPAAATGQAHRRLLIGALMRLH